MLKCILVDDEYLAIELLERLLQQVEEVEIIGTFTQGHEALDFLKTHPLDVVFLDIEMPGINGLELAHEVLNMNKETHIVFVTAFSQYAVDAFELNVMDYVLKPASKERIRKTIERVMFRSTHQNTKMLDEQGDKRPCIAAFDEFNLYEEQSRKNMVKFRTSKTKELLALLNENMDQPIHKNKVLGYLYEEEDPSTANGKLHISTYYLRKILDSLSSVECLEYKNGYFTLRSDGVYSEAFEFKKLYKRYRDKQDQSVEIMAKIVAIYRGKYLDGQDYPWVFEFSQWYEKVFVEVSIALATQFIADGMFEGGITCCRNIINSNPYHEEAYRSMVESYVELGDKGKAFKVYASLKEILKKDLGIEPTGKVRERIEALLK